MRHSEKGRNNGRKNEFPQKAAQAERLLRGVLVSPVQSGVQPCGHSDEDGNQSCHDRPPVSLRSIVARRQSIWIESLGDLFRLVCKCEIGRESGSVKHRRACSAQWRKRLRISGQYARMTFTLLSRCASFASFQDHLCGATLDKPSFATCLFAACQTGSSVVLSPQAEACHAADRTAMATLTRGGQSPPQHYHAYPIPTERRYWLKLADDRAVPSEIRNSGRMDSRRETEARRPAPNVIPIPVSVEEFSRIST